MSEAQNMIDPAIAARQDLVRTLAKDGDERARRLRATAIPQSVGMTVAGQRLADEIPRVLVARVQSALSDGSLAQRWKDALQRASQAFGGEPAAADAGVTALAALLVDQALSAQALLRERADEWKADAFRREGEAVALESLGQRFEALVQQMNAEPARAAAAAAVQEERRRQRHNGERPDVRGGIEERRLQPATGANGGADDPERRSH